MKKFVMTAAAAALLFTGSVNSASAQTVAELQAQITALMAQLGGTTVTTSTGASMLSDHMGVNIKVGSRGTRVSELQACMNAAGYNTGVVDGIYGKNTAAGVKAFQASKGLAVDGIVGVKTTPAFQAACPTTGTTTGTTTPTPSTELKGGESDFTFEDISAEDADDSKKDELVVTATFKSEDADSKITRFDITLDGGTDRPYKFMDQMVLKVDGKEVASEDTSSKSDWTVSGTEYKLRFAGLNIMVPEGDEVDVEVYIDTTDEGTATFATDIEARYEDGLGYTDTVTDSTSFDVVVGSVAKATVTESNDNPEDSTITGSEDEVTMGAEVLVFDVEAKNEDITLEDIEVTFTATGSTAANLIKKAYLYNGSKLVDSTTVSSSSITFDMSELDIDEDDSEEFTVKLDLNKINGGTVVEGSTIVANVTDVLGYDANDDDIDTFTATSFGNVHTFSIDAPSLDLDGVTFPVTVTDTGADYATAVFKFDVTAGEDEDVYLSTALVDWGVAVTGGTAGAFVIEASDDGIEEGATGFKISKGTTESFTLSQVVTGTGAFAKVTLNSVKWDIDDATTAFSKTLTAGLTNFKTTSTFIAS